MNIEARAPIRIDLAGGTVDIWPLYLFLKDPLTINLAINLYAEARVIERPAGRDGAVVRLASEDQGHHVTFPWKRLRDQKVGPGLRLHLALLQHFAQRRAELGSRSIEISTLARSPAGAGLGGSSALNIALTGALSGWESGGSKRRSEVEMIDVARDVETRILGIPAGLQDYYGSMFGGLQELHWGVAQPQRRELPLETARGLEERLILFYSGKSRNSGINNWLLFKNLIDSRGRTRDTFQRIVEATLNLKTSLDAKDWRSVGDAIASEWRSRRRLATHISTPEIEKSFHRARALGVKSYKICGAGGGGCFFVYLPSGDPELRQRVTRSIESTKVKHLPFRLSEQGLQLQTNG